MIEQQGKLFGRLGGFMEEIDHTSFQARQGNGATRRQIDGTGRAILGATAVICGTFAAIVSMPDDPRPSGALFWPAVWCSVGLLTAPLLGLRKNIQTILTTENVLMIGLVYWLLLDLLQGAYSLDDVSYDDIAWAFTSIGAMGVGIWIGMAGGGWSLPQLILGVAKRRLSGIALFRAIWITFFIGMFYFAYSCDFNPSLMIDALGWCRFCAPWATSGSGGWNAFLVHLQYFGYVLPSLTVLLAQREGWLRPKTLVGIILSIIMITFLSQQGGRRIIGVVVGAALVTWLILQKRLKPKVLVGGVIGITLLLVFMEIMLQNRRLGFSSAYPTSGSKSRLHVDDNFLRLSEIIHFIPEGQPYVGLAVVVLCIDVADPACHLARQTDWSRLRPDRVGWGSGA